MSTTDRPGPADPGISGTAGASGEAAASAPEAHRGTGSSAPASASGASGDRAPAPPAAPVTLERQPPPPRSPARGRQLRLRLRSLRRQGRPRHRRHRRIPRSRPAAGGRGAHQDPPRRGRARPRRPRHRPDRSPRRVRRRHRPSGAGKSTLLHLLGGLQRPDGGTLRLDGESTDSYSEARWAVERRRRIGIVFQFFNLVSNLTVADNVELPPCSPGPPRRRHAQSARNSSPSWASPPRPAACPASCPAASSSAWPSPAPSSAHRGCSSRTSPQAASTARAPARSVRLLSRFHQRGQTIVLVTHDARLASAADRVISFFDGRITDDARLDAGPAAGAAATPARVVELRD